MGSECDSAQEGTTLKGLAPPLAAAGHVEQCRGTAASRGDADSAVSQRRLRALLRVHVRGAQHAGLGLLWHAMTLSGCYVLAARLRALRAVRGRAPLTRSPRATALPRCGAA